METVQQIGAALLTMALAIIAGAAPFVVKFVLAHVQARLKFDIATKDEERLERLVTEGVHFIEEEYRGKSEKGLLKQNDAVTHVMDAIKRSGLPEQAEEHVVKLIKAKLGQHRHEAGGGAS